MLKLDFYFFVFYREYYVHGGQVFCDLSRDSSPLSALFLFLQHFIRISRRGTRQKGTRGKISFFFVSREKLTKIDRPVAAFRFTPLSLARSRAISRHERFQCRHLFSSQSVYCQTFFAFRIHVTKVRIVTQFLYFSPTVRKSSYHFALVASNLSIVFQGLSIVNFYIRFFFSDKQYCTGISSSS